MIEGIVLRKINYSESSLILKLLTENGIKSFIFPGAKRKNKTGNLSRPLAVVNVSFFSRNDSDLGKITEISLSEKNLNLYEDPIKATVVYFLNELLEHSITEEEENVPLYEFVKHGLQILNLQQHYSNFPIKFSVELLRYLGYYPQIEPTSSHSEMFFDLMAGKMVPYEPKHPQFIQPVLTSVLMNLMNESLTENHLKISSIQRQKLLVYLMDYYKYKMDGFRPLKSIEVLETILR